MSYSLRDEDKQRLIAEETFRESIRKGFRLDSTVPTVWQSPLAVSIAGAILVAIIGPWLQFFESNLQRANDDRRQILTQKIALISQFPEEYETAETVFVRYRRLSTRLHNLIAHRQLDSIGRSHQQVYSEVTDVEHMLIDKPKVDGLIIDVETVFRDDHEVVSKALQLQSDWSNFENMQDPTDAQIRSAEHKFQPDETLLLNLMEKSITR